MAHDFKAFPELREEQMTMYYFDSPHKQIFEDFDAHIERVIDGDTVRVTCDFRDFSFPVRMAEIAAPELDEFGGRESKEWMRKRIEGEDVRIEIDPSNRVGKWGRLIGKIFHSGMDVGQESMIMGQSIEFQFRNSYPFMDFNKELEGVMP